MTVLLVSSNETDIIKMCMCANKWKENLICARNLDECHSLFSQKEFDMIITDRTVWGSGTFCVRDHVISSGFEKPLLVYNEEEDENLEELWVTQNEDSPLKAIIREFATVLSKNTVSLHCFAQNLEARPQIKTLLQLFFLNIGKPLSIEMISETLWGFADRSRKPTVYAYMSELREILKTNGAKRDSIKTHKGKYILRMDSFL